MSRLFLSVALAASLGGCVVAAGPGPAPAPYAYTQPVAPPVGVAYVGPTYAVPGPGYAWRWHPRYGWGWWHPRYGWHRGWR